MLEHLDILRFPLSALLGVGFLLAIYLLQRIKGASRLVKTLAGWRCGAAVMGVVAVMMAIEGIWGTDIHSTIPFFAAVLLLQMCLELTTLARLQSERGWPRSKVTFISIHSGMLLMTWAAFWGAPDHVEGRIRVDAQEATATACDRQGMAIPLPFSLQLDSFTIDCYADSLTPKQYTSRLVASEPGNSATIETSVNHPCRHKGYSIFQEDYDQLAMSYTVLRVVRDPWLPLVYLGMILLALGSSMTLAGSWKRKVLIPAVGVLAVVFAAASIARIHFDMLPPALRSLWFVPHLILYMVAYSAMAISVVLCLYSYLGRRFADSSRSLSEVLLRTSSVLLLAGMLCGCVWARRAWGDYWTWDPKECWAAVTWLLTLVYLHLLPMKKKSPILLAITLLAAFLALQVTWYGVNHLPSATESMHTYLSNK